MPRLARCFPCFSEIATMGGRAWLGWAAAGGIALTWLSSSGEDPAPSQHQPPQQRAEGGSSVTAPNAPAAPTVPPSVEPIARTTAPSTPAPLVTEQEVERVLFTQSNARLRETPSTAGKVLWTVPRNTAIVSHESRDGWHRVTAGRLSGWVSDSLLKATRPELLNPPRQQLAPPAPIQPPARSRSSGEPVREPYVGTCDCPYDLMRNGRRCGGRSAYSRPGGRSPQCFF